MKKWPEYEPQKKSNFFPFSFILAKKQLTHIVHAGFPNWLVCYVRTLWCPSSSVFFTNKENRVHYRYLDTEAKDATYFHRICPVFYWLPINCIQMALFIRGGHVMIIFHEYQYRRHLGTVWTLKCLFSYWKVQNPMEMSKYNLSAKTLQLVRGKFFWTQNI